MNKSAQELLSQALVLSPGDRAALAAELIDSLDPDSDSDTEQAWIGELTARIESIERGEVACVSWEAARRMISGEADG